MKYKSYIQLIFTYGGNKVIVKKIIRYIKKLFGFYENGYEYYVNLHDIVITAQFSESKPGFKKMEEKFNYYLKNDKLPAPIILNHDFILIDGYISYLICESYGIMKVPVQFAD